MCSSALGACGPHDLGDLGERLDGADLVVDERHRHERDVGVEGGGELLEVDEAAPSTADRATARLLHRVQHGVVLDGGADDRAAPRAEHAAHGEVVGLGAAAGEHDLAGLAAHHRGQALPGPVERGASLAGEGVGCPTGCRSRR